MGSFLAAHCAHQHVFALVNTVSIYIRAAERVGVTFDLEVL